jgi:histidinol phosphatase-like enzyme
MFYFVLHPLEWLTEKHGETVFQAMRLTDTYYAVMWTDESGTATVKYSVTDVMEAVASGKWIMTDEKGEF